MSRYSAVLENGNEVAWGHDIPLNEFFIQEFPANDEDEPLFCIGNNFSLNPHPRYPKKTVFTNEELVDVFNDYKDVIPPAHILSVACNKPF